MPVPQGLWRLVDSFKRQQKRLEDEKRHEKKETASDELELGADAGLTKNGSSGDLLDGEDATALLTGDSAANSAGPAGVRRVAFETTVRTDSGGHLPLRTESATERSAFVRGVGPVYPQRDMDGLRQYSAPWGYQLLERLTPRGRGFSLQARCGSGGPGAGLCWGGGHGACCCKGRGGGHLCLMALGSAVCRLWCL